MNVNGVTASDNCTPNNAMVRQNRPCPDWYSKRPDSDASVSSTVGEGVLETDYNSAKLGKPFSGSPLLDRFASRVPVDIDNRIRGSVSDVGAMSCIRRTRLLTVKKSTFRQISLSCRNNHDINYNSCAQ